jgi:conjugative relaxase-like TrwC/TraI family protein
VLTISKPLSAGQAQSYHQKEFTAKEQNYWSQRGVIASEWQGRLASQLGLAGEVSAEDFAKLNQGQRLQTGDNPMRQRVSCEYQDAGGTTVKTMEHRAGCDATFSAPNPFHSPLAMSTSARRTGRASPLLSTSSNTIRKPASAAIMRE